MLKFDSGYHKRHFGGYGAERIVQSGWRGSKKLSERGGGVKVSPPQQCSSFYRRFV